jgi:hypothetical protein
VSRGRAGRVAPRLIPSDIIAALLAELRPWAWRARAAAQGSTAGPPDAARVLWEQARFAAAAPGVPARQTLDARPRRR